jgi:hypothetical protein
MKELLALARKRMKEWKMLTHKQLRAKALSNAEVRAEYEKLADALGCKLEIRLVRRPRSARNITERSSSTTPKRVAT